MKKILFLIHDLHYGGAEKVLVNLANNLDKTKYDVTVQTLFDVGHNKLFLTKDVHYIGGLKRFFPGNATLMKLLTPQKLCKLVVKDDYDIVVSFLEGPCCRIVSAYNGKRIAWIHTDFINKKVASGGFRNYKEAKLCYSKFNRIISVSDTVKLDFEESFERLIKSDVLYNVNDTDTIIKSSKIAQDSIDNTDSAFKLISVGKLDCKTKGYDSLIRIHKKLIDSNINSKLYLVGEGADRIALEKLIKELDIDDSCILLGYNDNPYKFVAACDLFVCSSHVEGFSTAVTEALVLGVPVVSTEVSGAKELLGNNNEYGIVTENNENALYDGVYKMLTEDGLLEHYKKQAQVRGKEFSAEKTTKAVEEILDNVLGK